MRFKYNQLVRVINGNRLGRVAGFCHYIRPVDVIRGGKEPLIADKQMINEGVIVNLLEGFFDSNEETFISMMIAAPDAIEVVP